MLWKYFEKKSKIFEHTIFFLFIGIPLISIMNWASLSPFAVTERHAFYVDGNFHTLEMASTKFDDAGLYTVEARNAQGAVSCQCNVIVDGGIRAYVSPIFTNELEDRSLFEGATVTLVARVEAYPAVGVAWWVSLRFITYTNIVSS